METTLRPVLILSLLIASGIAVFLPQTRIAPTFANPAEYTLHGHTVSGWGFTPASIDTPGPDLNASPGETVFMHLYAADNIGHNFGIDTNGDGFYEIESNIFSSSTTAFNYQFNAPTTPATYTYICIIHGPPMIGSLIVTANHDISVLEMTVSRNFAYSGVPSNPILVSITVANQGQATETFSVTGRASANIIGSQTITLTAGAFSTVAFSWAANLLPRGTYTLSADVPQLTGETDLADNTLTAGQFTVRLGGDINNDCTVNILDLVLAGTAFGSTPTSGNWNPQADLNNDNTINILDLVLVGTNFAQACPA